MTRRVLVAAFGVVLGAVVGGVGIAVGAPARTAHLCGHPYVLVGSAQPLAGGGIRLTDTGSGEAGGAWLLGQRRVGRGFTAFFRFHITPYHGADGVAFVMQAEKWDPLGIPGRGIGYEGIKRSVSVEYDPWQNIASDWPRVPNPIGDPSDNHISVHTRGPLANNANEVYSLGSTSAIPDLADGAEHVIRLHYEPGKLRVYIDTSKTPSLTVPLRLTRLLHLDHGKAWIGFTGSTGDVTENQDVLGAGFRLPR